MEKLSIFKSESILQISVLLKDYNQLEEMILKKCFDLNNKSYCMEICGELVFGVTPLHVAVLVNDIKAAKLLLSSGADINALTVMAVKRHKREVRKYSSLHIAVLHDYQEMIELLISSGADLNIEDELGLTPIEFSLEKPSICAVLIGSGADVERFNFNPDKVPLIFRAINLQNLQLVKIFGRLLNKYVYYQNQTPIEYAMTVFPSSVEYLISYGIGLHFKDTKSGETLLHLAIRKKNEKWIKLLLEKDLNPNIGNNCGNRPLHIAVFAKCSPKILLILISFGANPNLKNNEGFNPLKIAIGDGNVALTQLLFKYGSKLSPQLIELKNAIRYRQYKTCLVLLNNLNDCQIKTLKELKFNSESIMWFFVRHVVGDQESDVNDLVAVMKKLIELGSDLNCINTIWGTLMHFIIYAMECVPNPNYKPLFKALISSPECDKNQEFVPQNTQSKSGEEIVKERIACFGNALTFALTLSDCEFFAEELINVGANVHTFDWEKFWFAPKKIRALKMLYYSGCEFPKDFHTLFMPQFEDFDETYKPEVIAIYFKEFEAFNQWLLKQQSNPWSLKNICYRIIRESHKSFIPQDSVQFMKFELNHD